ncbi:MAG: phosphatase PAP2 family protein [Gemmatimonadales bacterium]
MALRRLRRVDLVLLAWVGVATAAGLARLDSAPRVEWVFAAHGLVLVLIALLRFARAGRTGAVVGELYPLLLILALYGSLDLLAASGGVRTWDSEVRLAEEALFGAQISRTWWQSAPSRFWSTVLHASYFSYYLVVPAGPLWFLRRRDHAALRRSVLVIFTTFVLCYACFLFFPVAGPYYEFPRPDRMMLDNWAARLVYGVLENGSSYGAAFPSSHVAATLAATGAAAIASPRLGLVLALPSLLLTIGVVYCQMHYAVDAVAGVLVASVVLGVVRMSDGQTGRRTALLG